eukprot:444420-Pelagomonas_calceolata.AAC.7
MLCANKVQAGAVSTAPRVQRGGAVRVSAIQQAPSRTPASTGSVSARQSLHYYKKCLMQNFVPSNAWAYILMLAIVPLSLHAP